MQIKNNRLQIIRNVLLFLIGVSINYENVAISGSSRNFTIALILSIFYVISLLPALLHQLYKLTKYQKYYKPWMAFFILLIIMNILHIENYVTIVPTSMILDVLLMMLIILHAEVSNDKEKVASLALNGMAIGALALPLLFSLGIGVEYEANGTDRMSMFGANENELGVKLAISSLTLIYNFLLKDYLHLKIFRFLLMYPVLMMVVMILQTGSRLAFISLFVGLILIIILYPTKRKWIKFLFAIASLILLYYGYALLEDYTVIYYRLMSTMAEGDTGGREYIWKKLLPELLTHPILGVGQTGYATVCHKLGFNQFAYGFSPHNVLIEIFAYTGIVGLIAILIFWFRIVAGGIKTIKYLKNILPLVLFIPLIGAIMTGQLLMCKYAYLIYASTAIYTMLVNQDIK